MMTFPYSYQQPVPQNQVQAPAQQPVPTYDFIGKYVKSYDEVKNSSFLENTMIYLDTEHDRIYIKKISDEGVPQINVLGLTDIQSPIQTQELTDSSVQSVEVDVNQQIENLTNSITKKIDEKFNEIKKDMKTIKGF
jgi:hypothetical protein